MIVKSCSVTTTTTPEPTTTLEPTTTPEPTTTIVPAGYGCRSNTDSQYPLLIS